MYTVRFKLVIGIDMPNVVRSLAYTYCRFRSLFLLPIEIPVESSSSKTSYTLNTVSRGIFYASTSIHGADPSFPILLTQKVPHQRCQCKWLYVNGALWNALKFALKSLCLIWSCYMYIQMPKSSWFCMRKSFLKIHPHESPCCSRHLQITYSKIKLK